MPQTSKSDTYLTVCLGATAALICIGFGMFLMALITSSGRGGGGGRLPPRKMLVYVDDVC